MARPLHPDDVVLKRANEAQIGIIERTHADVSTHDPNPESLEAEPIKHDRSIAQPLFRKFKRDGVPPKGTVLVRWQGQEAAHLVEESKLKLLDRSLLIGDVVKRKASDAESGVVVNTLTKCTLQPMCDIKYRDNHILKGLLPPAPPSPGIRKTATGTPAVIPDVPASELVCIETPTEEDLLIYKDWIGRVEGVTSKIALLLTDGCVAEINDELAEHADGGADAFVLGDIAMTKKGHLRTGRWIFGQYTPNTPPIGTVVQVRHVTVGVSWLQKRIGCKSEVEPPSVLEREELESEDFCIYDRTRKPAELSTLPSNTHHGKQSTTSNSETEVQLSQRMRFRSLPDALAKYPHLPRIDRQSTRGYDLNLFDVTRFTTTVTVQWQDLSISEESSVDLVPDTELDDEHAAWPGEIAHSLDVATVPGMKGVEQPGRVGVIQTVDAGERIASIKWAGSAVVQYSVDDGEGRTGGIGDDGGDSADAEEKTEGRVLLTGVIGVAEGESEEVSLYDVEAPASLNVRRGDIVLVADPTSTRLEGLEEGSEGHDWVGEIVDTCLDGTLIIRLGAATKARDVRLKREEVVVAIRSDGTDDDDVGDGWEEGEDDEYEDVANSVGLGPGGLPDWHERPGEEVDDHMEESDGNEDSEADELVATYEDENGQPMHEDEVENEDWESEDEDGDLEMDDGVPQQIPRTSKPATPPETGILKTTTASDPTATEPPESYLVLSTDPPQSHHYASKPLVANPTQMKRIQKDHRILQKPNALPEGVYVRTWESRLDLLRVLFLGPLETPYSNAPFVVDFLLPGNYPTEPPKAFFHSWAAPQSLGGGGVGRVNPNLYEDGTICLSLLGTWEGDKGEGWNASRSTLLQVLVSLLGLVLVREPYFNEAGYEHLRGLEGSRRASGLYSERTYLRARTFVITALERVPGVAGEGPKGLEGLEVVIEHLYRSPSGPRLLGKVVEDLQLVLEKSESASGGGGGEPDGLTVMSRGVCIPLRRVLERLRGLQ
ncbi:hypothetical protein LTR08_002481 [Meristemomyces frigidus]|nr:hypothetical protein LTR08_002481 [Meristemomyces frigidus]